MPYLRSLLVAVVRSYVTIKDIRLFFGFIARGVCVPNKGLAAYGYLLSTPENKPCPVADLVVHFLEALTLALKEATLTARKEWAEDIALHFDVRWVTCIVFPGLHAGVGVAMLKLLNHLLSSQAPQKEEGKISLRKRRSTSFISRFEAADGFRSCLMFSSVENRHSVRSVRFLPSENHVQSWEMFSLLFDRLLSWEAPLKVFKDQCALFHQAASNVAMFARFD